MISGDSRNSYFPHNDSKHKIGGRDYGADVSDGGGSCKLLWQLVTVSSGDKAVLTHSGLVEAATLVQPRKHRCNRDSGFDNAFYMTMFKLTTDFSQLF